MLHLFIHSKWPIMLRGEKNPSNISRHRYSGTGRTMFTKYGIMPYWRSRNKNRKIWPEQLIEEDFGYEFTRNRSDSPPLKFMKNWMSFPGSAIVSRPMKFTGNSHPILWATVLGTCVECNTSEHKPWTNVKHVHILS